MKDAWMPIESCPTVQAKEDATPILVWHVFQGVMLSDTLTVRDSRFHVYWMRLPETWVDPLERLPTAEDADSQRCVVAVDKYGSLRLIGWEQIEKPSDIRRWIPCPPPPPDYLELRRVTHAIHRRSLL